MDQGKLLSRGLFCPYVQCDDKPAVQRVGHGADDADHEPEVGGVWEVEADLGDDQHGGRDEGDGGRGQLQEGDGGPAPGEYPVDDVHWGGEGVVHRHEDGDRDTWTLHQWR